MHAATLAKSDRLQRVLLTLKDREWHSSMYIAHHAQTVAPGTCVSELRKNGFDILCRQVYDGKRRRWEYRLNG